MTASKYPKAQAFLDAHPNMNIDEAIAYLEKQLNRNGVNNADGIKL